MYTRRKSVGRKSIKYLKKGGRKTKVSRKRKSNGGGWVGDYYLFKAIKRNFFPSEEDKKRNLLFYKNSSVSPTDDA